MQRIVLTGNVYPECKILKEAFLRIRELTKQRYGVIEYRCVTGFWIWKKHHIKYMLVKCLNENTGEYEIVTFEKEFEKFHSYETVLAFSRGILESLRLDVVEQ